MNRREFSRLLGALSVAGLVTQAKAQHQHHDHAAPAAPKSTRFSALQAAAADCVSTGQTCLAHCLQLMAGGDKSMADCAVAVNQMLALCGALQSLAAQDAPLTRAQAKVALDACTRCADACKPHAAHHAECKACHESCLACIKACKAIA